MKLLLFNLVISYVVPVSLKDYYFDVNKKLGRRFDGFGAISGGGATSKLLVNYPSAHLSQVLDFLFKPQFGASLDILKVEIGGDAQSSEGTEASHMHSETDIDFNRGYEWWLMGEAKKRNPLIKLYGLPWGWPGWVGSNSWWPFIHPEKPVMYIVNWLRGARSHNFTIDYIGLWNEKPYSTDYIVMLRRALDAGGFAATQIVAADQIGSSAWEIADDVLRNSSVAAAVHALGGHYTDSRSSPAARSTGKPLWSSEESTCLLFTKLNRNYVEGLMSSTIAWNLVTAYYDGLSYDDAGMMTAQQPWSGHYRLSRKLWAIAHTTQFSEPGWSYLSHGEGVGLLGNNTGSYVSLISPDLRDFSIVVETMNAAIPTNVSFVFKNYLAKKLTKLFLWQSNMSSVDERQHFVAKGSIQVAAGAADVVLQPDFLYTLSTVADAARGSFDSPPVPKPFPLPYFDDFEGYNLGQEAFLLVAQVGYFEVAARPGRGKVLRQVVPRQPVFWCPVGQTQTVAVIGSRLWQKMNVTVDVCAAASGSDAVFVATNVDRGGCYVLLARGYFGFLDFRALQASISTDIARTHVIARKTVTLQRRRWYSVTLSEQEETVELQIDGKLVLSVGRDPSASRHGFAGFGTDGFGAADFDNLRIYQNH